MVIAITKASQYLVDRNWSYTAVMRSKAKCSMLIEDGVDLEWLIEQKPSEPRITQRLFPKEHVVE